MKKHLAGIIPVSGLKSDFNMPWHESLMPLAPNYLAVERAVAECAYAGCSTIWIVCNDDVQPLIRYQVGEKIEDPVYVNRHYEKNRSDFCKSIRIYYIPVHPRDLNKRDCLSWGVIHGALSSMKIMGSLSRWTAPDKFYVSWPYGYYDPSIVQPFRRAFSERSVVFSYKTKTIAENVYAGLTLTRDHIKQLHKEVKIKSTGLWSSADQGAQRLARNERFSYRNFLPSDVFDTIDLVDYEKVELEDYYSLDSWGSYCSFLSLNKDISKPDIVNYKEWNEISFDE